MLGFDPRQYGETFATLILGRGSAPPPLQWHERPNRLILQRLDALDAGSLFQGQVVCDSEEAKAVHAALYLWYGHVRECVRLCDAVKNPDHTYLKAICLRQAGYSAAAKKMFHIVGDHPVFALLLPHCRQLIGASTDRLLRRFLATVNQIESFEPYAFINLYNQAVFGKASGVAVEFVRSIQSAEFGLLLRHCLERACQADKPIGNA